MHPEIASEIRRPSLSRAPLTFFYALLLCLCASSAAAQINRPGAHPQYVVELEPHGLIQWDVEPWDDEGLGLGFRASIPVMQNGPVKTINNSFAIGFGIDWAHSGDNCWGYNYRPYDPRIRFEGDCDADNILFPVVAQWNFFFTPAVSAFAELGLAIVYETWDWGLADDDDIDVEPVFLLGPRFILGDMIAIPIRIGWPYLSVGVSFLI